MKLKNNLQEYLKYLAEFGLHYIELSDMGSVLLDVKSLLKNNPEVEEFIKEDVVFMFNNIDAIKENCEMGKKCLDAKICDFIESYHINIWSIKNFSKDGLSLMKEIQEYLLKKVWLKDIKCIEKFGGEDMGSEYYIIVYHKDYDEYIKLDFYYTSYDGAEYETMYNVIPKEKTVITYEPID